MVGGSDSKGDRLASTELLIFGDTEFKWKEAGPLPQPLSMFSATTVANTVYASGEYNLESDGGKVKITITNIPYGQSSAKLPVPQLHSHLVTRSLGHSVTLSLGHSITWSLGHSITWSLGHSVTIFNIDTD